MIRKALNVIRKRPERDLACVVGGMGALMAGRKLSALALFAYGFRGLEQEWRERRGFEGGWDERLAKSAEFYEGTHQDPTNRTLHRVGIPMILGGAAGLFLFPAYRPAWLASNALWTGGWVLNFIGHGVYEKNAPAFADDPLAFLAGPLWDLKQLRGGAAPAPAPAVEAPAQPEPELVGAA